MNLPNTSLSPYGLDPRKFLRGESVNYGVMQKSSVDTEQEISTGPHSVSNHGNHNDNLNLINKSISTVRKHSYLKDIVTKRKEYF